MVPARRDTMGREAMRILVDEGSCSGHERGGLGGYGAMRDDEMLATMHAIKNPSFWEDMMMPGCVDYFSLLYLTNGAQVHVAGHRACPAACPHHAQRLHGLQMGTTRCCSRCLSMDE